MELSDEVRTGSGSDRVVLLANSWVSWVETRSLLLPVLTAQSSLIWFLAMRHLQLSHYPVSGQQALYRRILLAGGFVKP